MKYRRCVKAQDDPGVSPTYCRSRDVRIITHGYHGRQKKCVTNLDANGCTGRILLNDDGRWGGWEGALRERAGEERTEGRVLGGGGIYRQQVMGCPC